MGVCHLRLVSRPFPCPSLRTPPPAPLAEAKPRTNFLLSVVSFYAKAKNTPLIKNSDNNVGEKAF